MQLRDGLKHSGQPFEIPDISRDDLPQFFQEMGFKAGAEIGVAQGNFSEKFLKMGLELFAIDSWKAYEDYPNPRLDADYEQAKNLLSAYPNGHIIRKTSMEAAADFKDNSLDFVYIDGNHQLKFVIEDLVEWTKKVKPGGIIAGHDYVRFIPKTALGICHVIEALKAYTQAYGIKNWYVLGTKSSSPGEKRDKWRSWMFIKP